MKAHLCLIAITAIAFASGQARAQEKSSCEGCAAKQKQIEALQAELATLRGPADAPPPPEPAAPAPPAETGATETPTQTATTDYTVASGDNLGKIARKHGCSTQQLAELNGLKPDAMIRIGQKLKVPANSEAQPTTLDPVTPPPPAPAAATYTIQDGDTYYGISKKLGIPVNQLMAANPNIKPNQLFKGRKIQLPAGTGSMPEPQSLTPDQPTPPSSGPAHGPASGPTQPIRQITIDSEISFGAFAEKHGTSVERLNALNDLNLTSSTILAKGSELFVPAQP